MDAPALTSPLRFFRRRHLADKLAELVIRSPEDGKAIEALVDYRLRMLDLAQLPAPTPAKAPIARVPTRLRRSS